MSHCHPMTLHFYDRAWKRLGMIAPEADAMEQRILRISPRFALPLLPRAKVKVKTSLFGFLTVVVDPREGRAVTVWRRR